MFERGVEMYSVLDSLFVFFSQEIKEYTFTLPSYFK